MTVGKVAFVCVIGRWRVVRLAPLARQKRRLLEFEMSRCVFYLLSPARIKSAVLSNSLFGPGANHPAPGLGGPQRSR